MNAVTTFEACKAVPALPAAELEIAKGFARASKAAATRRAYQKDFARFTAWCDQRHIPPIPAAPETVAAFLAAEAARGIKPATIGRRVAAIRYAHKLAGHDDPPTSSEVVKATVQGIRRMLGAAPVRKTPATADKVVAMAALADADMKGLRDRAILLLGFAGAFRRSELVALDVTDLEFCDGGMRVHIRRSKTDQEGAGDTIAIALGSVACPVKAVRAWLEASKISTGRCFGRSAKAVGSALTGWPITPWSGWSRRALAASVLTPSSSPAIRSGPASSHRPRGAAPRSSK
jgi:site-specific recombinase XerC